MLQILTLFTAFLLVSARATPLRAFSHHPRNQGIQWSPCEDDDLECGKINVPLDYTEPASNVTVELDMFRVPAVHSPSKGSILLNFGGPGASGRAGLTGYKEPLLLATGGHHDLIAVVPRGTGNNTLRFSCYDSEIERAIGRISNPITGGNSSDVALGRLWASSQVFAETCYAKLNKTGSFVGTSSNARDLISVVDALGEDGLLRYWGISYGTVLGATVSAMFPDRVDKVILDANVNVHEWYQNRESQFFSDSDKVFTAFCTGCIAAPESCPLAKNITASELEEKLYSLIDTLKYRPIVATIPGVGGTVVDYSFLKSRILSELYNPTGWPQVAVFLDGLLTDNMSAVGEYIATSLLAPPLLEVESQHGTKCSDSFQPSSNLDDLIPTIEKRHELSRIGGDTADGLLAQCDNWKMESKGRYEGDFQVKTKNPLLVIGNTGDPVTPLVTAKNTSSGFEGSVVLEHGAYGHGTLRQGSICTAKAIRAYFLNGTLPEPGVVCEAEAPLFSGKSGWDKVFEYFNVTVS